MEQSANFLYGLLIIFLSSLFPNCCWAKPTPSSLSKPSYDRSVWEHVNKTCLSHDCDENVNIQHLQHMATHMNRAIDPCENFHEYACGQWKMQHEEHTTMAVGERLLTERYEEIFARAKPNPLRGDRVYEKLQLYYDVCRESEREEKASWRHYVGALRAMGYLHFRHNESHWLGTLRDLNLFSNMRIFLFGHVERQNYSQFMLNLYPHDVDERVQLTQEIHDIFRHYNYTQKTLEDLRGQFENLEMDLENILRPSCANAIRDEDGECDLSQELSWQELLQRNSSINWQLLLSGFSLEPEDVVTANDFESMEKIKNYLDASSPRLLFLYSLTRFLNYLQNHPHNIVGKGGQPPACLRHMRKIFPLTMNYVYDRIFYNPERRSLSDPIITTIFEELKSEFSLSLDRNAMQLSAESIQYLKAKLKTLQLNIGNLPKNVSHEFYREFVGDLNINREQSFYWNHLEALRHFFRRHRRLASPSKFSPVWYSFNLHMPDFWDNLDTTAYYFSRANYIVLPFAYLQLPFYDHRFWPSLLYGDLANTLGHELIHAFDTKFLFYDHAGNYNEDLAMDIINNANFQSNRQCLEREPTEFLSERIADISGTRLALRTFIKNPEFLKHNGKLFFLQFAQFFCGSADRQAFAQLDSVHDPDSVRLNYTLAHIPEFAEVFECPLGSPMNPIEKCKLW
uniref:Peptidase family M13 n=1 Tax=Musca domestica TaxID=7370 RepID=A0A1I8N7R3_MUSDO